MDSQHKPQFYRPFYIRRALRILPAYYLVLLLLGPLSSLGLLRHRHVGWAFLALSVVYLSNVVTLFGVKSQYTVLWSLAVEEQFYIAWPTVVRNLSRRAIAGCCLLMIVACPVLRLIAFELGRNFAAPYPWLVADGLACGALLALFSRGPGRERKAMQRFSLLFLAGGVGVLLFGSPFGILHSSTLLGATLRLSGLNTFFTGVIGACLLLGTSRFRWIVRQPLLQFFGKISYGLYLIHMLVFDLFDHVVDRYQPNAMASYSRRFDLIALRFIIVAGIAVGVAHLSRITFEEYFLRQKDRLAPPRNVQPGAPRRNRSPAPPEPTPPDWPRS